jgi:hypothetical protein
MTRLCVQHRSTATGTDADGLAGTREDRGLRVWTRMDRLPVVCKQGVRGSSPLSSTERTIARTGTALVLVVLVAPGRGCSVREF